MPPTQLQTEAAFSLSDLAIILRRRFFWFALPAGLGALAAAGIALGLPPVYEAQTTILIVPANISEEVVRTTVVADKEARFQQARLRLLTRDSLASIIEEFELYRDASAPMEALVERMREDATIEPILPQIIDPRAPLEIDSVRISYRHEDPVISARVTTSLGREFIRFNIEARAADAQGTSDFLAAELKREEEELEGVLREITEFKEKHVGELPDDLKMNQTAVERLRREVNRVEGQKEEAQAQAMILQNQLQKVREGGGLEDDPLLQRREQIEAALLSFTAQGYTDAHPDVKLAKAQLAEVEMEVGRRADDADGLPHSTAVARLVSQLNRATVAAEVSARKLDRMYEDVAMYEMRIANSPNREAELAQTEGRADSLERSILQLREKKSRADTAKSLEAQQKGEKFRVIESAQPPSQPVSPNRPLVFVIGVLVGVLVGIVALVVREVTDARVYTIAELHEVLPIPVLATVPVIRLPSEIAEARARYRRWGLASAAAALLALFIGGAVYAWVAWDQSAPLPRDSASAGGGDV